MRASAPATRWRHEAAQLSRAGNDHGAGVRDRRRAPATTSTTACCVMARTPTATTAFARPRSPAWSRGISRGSSRTSRPVLRGTPPEDAAGHEMRPVGLAREERRRARRGGEVHRRARVATARADRQRATSLTARRCTRACAACHGAKGEGNQTLQAPALAARSDWYLVTQLANYQTRLARHRCSRHLWRADARHRQRRFPMRRPSSTWWPTSTLCRRVVPGRDSRD